MALLVSCQGPPPDDCERSCGNVSIPFPFGLTERCAYSGSNNIDFLGACNRSSSGDPKFTIMFNSTEVGYISTARSEIQVMGPVYYDCYNTSGQQDSEASIMKESYYYINFMLSKKNKFVAIGCDTQAGFSGNFKESSVCNSKCDSNSDITNGSCSGVGCCEKEIPEGIRESAIGIASLDNHKNVLQMNPCSYAFIVEEGKYNFSATDLLDFGGKELAMPMLLEWAIGNKTCDEVDKESDDFLCKGDHQECIRQYAGPGYRCRCKQGYDGNPYIKDNCTNIDECKAGTHNCKGECIDNAGSYTCPCPNGKPGEYRKDNNTCTTKRSPIIQISVGTSVAGLFLLLLITWIYLGYKRRKTLNKREKFFLQNGGIILKKRISGDGGPRIQFKLFTVDELKKATNKYDKKRIIGKGGFGTVFKGILPPNNRQVAIKMSSKIVDPTQTIQVEQFINEVIILSQVNHRNVVKLIGCCLETEVPSLVYEFIPNDTLYDHIHNERKSKPIITWDKRLRIATETAGALSYLFYNAADPIIHRDVKPTNILLDDDYAAKVADFGASRLIPIDQNELATKVQGTRGYLDPEYSQTGQLTEKSDVYSFGVVLVELLTGKKIVNQQTLVTKLFIDSLENKTLLEVLDKNLQLNKVPQDIFLVSKLAQRCLRYKGDERPTMREVAMELERISAASINDKHPTVKTTSNEAETKCLLNRASDDREDIDDTNTSSLIGVVSMMPIQASSETV
uniref:wall-associated receptor kinase 2-like n=1 Tax=Erigeron canadensis TaxID=72917 RepID=UPI001CB9CA0C|nr:wall-associated receptor kinase 2-like [Erigeron canadensis]